MYKALTIAKYAITKCVKDGCPISNLQLQKILFYIQKLFLSQDKVAFFDRIEAWQFGPVVPTVYAEFCGFGAMPITMTFSLDEEIDGAGTGIDAVIEAKRMLKPWDLVSETHKKGGAWDCVYQNGAGQSHEIPRDMIKHLG